LLDHQHELGRPLDLVNNGSLEISDKTDRIALGIGKDDRVVERKEWTLIVNEFADQGRFTRLAWAFDEDHAGVLKRRCHGGLCAPCYVSRWQRCFHGRLLHIMPSNRQSKSVQSPM
jgi:hypothetical protein